MVNNNTATAIRVVVENGRKYRVRGDRKLAVYIAPIKKTCGFTGRHLFVSGYWKAVKADHADARRVHAALIALDNLLGN